MVDDLPVAARAAVSGDAKDVAEAFHRIYYESHVWQQTYWLGVPAYKTPLDFWIYQEIVTACRPDLIIETGTAEGGSALFLASVCELLGHGEIITIDVVPNDGRPAHPRITYLVGPSTSPGIVGRVRKLAQSKRRVMAILDSNHSRDNVLGELHSYADLVSPGQYLAVEDTNLNGHPVRADFGPGPREAVEAFLEEDPPFDVDRRWEKFFLTFLPGGLLRRRVDGSPTEAALRETVADETSRMDSLLEHLEALTAREAELRRLSMQAHEDVLQRDRELMRLSDQLAAVYASRVWRYGSKLARLKRALSLRS